jgi:hypothetical protein
MDMAVKNIECMNGGVLTSVPNSIGIDPTPPPGISF